MTFQELGAQDSEPVSGDCPTDKDAWYEILAAKALFLSNGESPERSPYVRQEIAASWMHSAEEGVDPHGKQMCVPISEEEYEETLKRNASLMVAARPTLDAIEGLGLAEDYTFELIDSNGVTLLQTGNLRLHQYVAAKSVFCESTMGTNAHSLCMRYRTPFQVVGPEHYCYVLHDLAASAAPIMDENGMVVASLLLTQPVPAVPWEPWYKKLLSHTLGLIASLAVAVSHQLKFQSFKSVLTRVESRASSAAMLTAVTQSALEAALGASRERIVVLDGNGVIQQISPEAIHLLKTTPVEVRGRSIGEYIDLPDNVDLGSGLPEGRSVGFTVMVGRDEYDVEASPVPRGSGAILTFRKTRARTKTPSQMKAGDLAQVHFDDILGTCPSVKTVVSMAKRFALAHENVLIVGESGTGKDYFAQAIHNERCPDGPFMSINCAAIPPRLIESELFGYEAGSFTGADRNGKPGKIELADGGTLFLDEIGDMPLELQATLLRVLENKRVMRLGGKGYRQIEFKVISATNKDLSSMVEQGRFREDLLYRLSVLTLELPPLRDRGKDRLFFANYFLNECRRKNPAGPRSFSREAEAVLDRYPWPGNLRQMKNAIISAYYAAQDGEIRPEDFPLAIRGTMDRPQTDLSEIVEDEDETAQRAPSIRDLEEKAVVQAMKSTHGHVEEAARMLGISRATLYRRLKQYNIGQ